MALPIGIYFNAWADLPLDQQNKRFAQAVVAVQEGNNKGLYLIPTPAGSVFAERRDDDGWRLHVVTVGEAYNLTTVGRLYKTPTIGGYMPEGEDRTGRDLRWARMRKVLLSVLVYLEGSPLTPSELQLNIRSCWDELLLATETENR